MIDAAQDQRFMQLALTLGQRGLGTTWPNPSVGAVVVTHDGDAPVIVGRATTSPGGRPHAEPIALRHAGRSAAGATLYVTLEPCSHHGRTPPCVVDIIASGITRVVSALEDPNPEVKGRGHAALRAAGVTVDTGFGADAARTTHAGHIRRIRDGRPHVMLKLAVSADGKVGLSGRRPVLISGPTAIARVHLMRAMSDAILVGVGTVMADDPQLTCRLPGMRQRSPVRVVLDATLRISPDCNLIASAGETPVWIIAGPDASPDREQQLQDRGVEILRVPADGRRLDLTAALTALGTRGITRLMVEGGPMVAAGLIASDLIDEATLFHSPMTIGADGVDAFDGLPLSALTKSQSLTLRDIERVGEDTFETFVRA
jgi:diaminohydroxyphosphoribosylaminopyrimidine deaminase/5-amino-6-(5-phosphoribosylamino)uracil reductase